MALFLLGRSDEKRFAKTALNRLYTMMATARLFHPTF